MKNNKPLPPFPALLGLRAVAASLVFVYHYYGTENDPVSSIELFISLNYRMTIFFVLSGFGVTMSLLPRQRLSSKEYGAFLYKRFLRLLPLYLVILLVPYLQLGLPAWPEFLTNLTLTKGFFQKLMLTGIGPAWSLTVEITFYLVVPFILLHLTSGYKILKSYLVIILGGVLLTFIGYTLNNYHCNPYGFFGDIYFVLDRTFFGRVSDFFVGILLARFLFKYPHKEVLGRLPVIRHTYLALALIFLSSFLAFYLNNLASGLGTIMGLLFAYLVLPLAVGYFVLSLIKESTLLSRFLSSRFMLMAGSSSYGFYLMHTSWVQFKLNKINPLPEHSFVLLWLTAALSYYFFEKPVMLYFRKRHLAG